MYKASWGGKRVVVYLVRSMSTIVSYTTFRSQVLLTVMKTDVLGALKGT